MDCTCHDGIICDACVAAQIEQTLQPSTNFTLTTEEVDALTDEVTTFLNTLKPTEEVGTH
jgi:hypothetical protein